jgi:hypothetical protein
MRIFNFIKKFFKRTEVPLTPEQELALREQMRIMGDLAIADETQLAMCRERFHKVGRLELAVKQ